MFVSMQSRRELALGLVAGFLATASKSLAQPAGPLDRVPTLIAQAKTALLKFKPARTDRAIVCDYSQPSNLKRLYIFDFVSGSVSVHLVSHGRGSDRDDTWTPRGFNGPEGSNTSIIGAMIGAERYQGDHGLSLRLDGVESASILARSREIVVHTAAYMEADFIATNKRPGRSLGCFVVQAAVLEEVVATLENGGLLLSVA